MSNGERRHETCRYGTLTPAWRIDAATGGETATLMPLCTWGLPEPCPPAAKRGWGGAVEFDRDCAVCSAHTPVDGEPSAAPRRVRFVFAPRMGLAGLRVGNTYFKLKAPWNRPLFSERYGYERTLGSLGGWRLLRRELGRSIPETATQ